MNLHKIQQEMLKVIFKGDKDKRVISKYDNERVLVTLDGYVAYLLPLNQLYVRIDDFRESTGLSKIIDDHIVEERNELLPTDEYSSGGKIRKYVKLTPADASLYTNIETSLLKNFDRPKLYQPNNPRSAVMVTEVDPYTDMMEIVGVVMPHK